MAVNNNFCVLQIEMFMLLDNFLYLVIKMAIYRRRIYMQVFSWK
jgi:hypothetical protein